MRGRPPWPRRRGRHSNTGGFALSCVLRFDPWPEGSVRGDQLALSLMCVDTCDVTFLELAISAPAAGTPPIGVFAFFACAGRQSTSGGDNWWCLFRFCSRWLHCVSLAQLMYLLFFVCMIFGCSVLDDVNVEWEVAQVGTLASHLGCRGVRFVVLILNGRP